jgi:hypothetical protein
MDKQDIEFQKVQILNDYFQTRVNALYSYVYGAIVGILVLMLTLYYNKVFDLLGNAMANLFFFIVILIGIGFVFKSYLLKPVGKTHDEYLAVIDNLFLKVENGETLNSLSELKNLVNSKKKNKTETFPVITTRKEPPKKAERESKDEKYDKNMIWIARKEEIKEDFEETRRCLLNSYHSYVQTHAGYIIALIIGLSAIISTFDFFIKTLGGTLGFIFLVFIAIPILTIIMFLRITFWTIFANYAISMPMDKIVANFNEYHIKYLENAPAPNTAVIQFAILKEIGKNLNNMPFLDKCAVKIARVLKSLE